MKLNLCLDQLQTVSEQLNGENQAQAAVREKHAQEIAEIHERDDEIASLNHSLVFQQEMRLQSVEIIFAKFRPFINIPLFCN